MTTPPANLRATRSSVARELTEPIPPPLTETIPPPPPAQTTAQLQQTLLDQQRLIETLQIKLDQVLGAVTANPDEVGTEISASPSVLKFSASDILIGSPEKFTGQDKSKLTIWLAHLDEIFEMYGANFHSERVKVIYAASHLSEGAARWYYANKKSKVRPIWVDNWSLFKKAIKTAYGDANRVRNATEKMRECRQTGSILKYITEFRSVMNILDWGNEALCSQYEGGLHPKIRELIIPYKLKPTDDIEDWIQASTEAYENYTAIYKNFAKDIENQKRTVGKTDLLGKGIEPARSSTENLDDNSRGPPRRKLSEVEKKRRRDSNLCMYCGAPGHIAINCPLTPKKSTLSQATITPTVDTIVSSQVRNHQENDSATQ